MSSPASPSGNRHDGVRVYAAKGDRSEPWTFYRADGVCWPPTHVAHPVDIDAARTAVIDEARALINLPRGSDAWLDALSEIKQELATLDALTTKGATT